MLRASTRHILHFDLAMAPFPSDAPPIPLKDMIPTLQERCKEGKCVQTIESGRRVIRLSQLQLVTLPDDTEAAALLFCMGDRDKADPGFTNFTNGAIRIVGKEENEGGGLSVHALVRLTPTKPKGHLYRMVCEDVSGFGKSLLQSFLRHEFRIISEDNGLEFERESGSRVKTRPIVELHGHASERLKNSLKNGRLLHIELIQDVSGSLGFDEAYYAKTARQDLKISVAKELPKDKALAWIETVKLWARQKNYESMRIRWRGAGESRPQSATVDTDRADAGEALFIKSTEVKLSVQLPEISKTICDDLINKMMALLV